MKIPRLREKIKEHNIEIILLFVFIILSCWVTLSSSPTTFNKDIIIEIEEGATLKEVSQLLKDEKIIQSRSIFSTLLIIQGKDDNIVAGDYQFDYSHSIFEVSKRITTGDYGIELSRITLTEGLTLRQMANMLADQYPKFDKELFLVLTQGKEGYLFPETYFFPENIEAREVIEVLKNTFIAKMEEIKSEISSSPYTLEEIVIMASIVEKEATKESREDVANILWNRLDIDMALQVDAPFVYERNKGTFDLSIADLEEDSPYNTYTNRGLIPTPISNPGIDSILAAANPEPTNYLFFLTGHDGEMYYAETFEGHKENKRLYLN